MPRVTVTILPEIDRLIRIYQAKLLLGRNEDVTYTEALNEVLYWALLQAEAGALAEIEEIEEATQNDEEVWHVEEEFPSSLSAFKDTVDSMQAMEGAGILLAFKNKKLQFEGKLDALPTSDNEHCCR